jgi:tRNA modification GTPase
VTEPDQPLDDEALAYLAKLPTDIPVARIVNKLDLTAQAPGRETSDGSVVIRLSARTGAGVEALRAWLLEVAGWKPHGEGIFVARQRHLVALHEAAGHLADAPRHTQAFELMAEELRLAQVALGRITGEVTADDVLGAIFSRFCIGK